MAHEFKDSSRTHCNDAEDVRLSTRLESGSGWTLDVDKVTSLEPGHSRLVVTRAGSGIAQGVSVLGNLDVTVKSDTGLLEVLSSLQELFSGLLRIIERKVSWDLVDDSRR